MADEFKLKQIKARKVLETLEQVFPNAQCELNFSTPFELLVAVILSAQCTDKRVNLITPHLFSLYNTPEQFASVDEAELEGLIFTCGFYHNKARNIINASRALLTDFGGQVPNTAEELVRLPGVGRKTANVVASVAFGEQAIAVDTHVYRVSRRLGLADGNTPEKVEQQLNAVIDKPMWNRAHHLLIFHGRYTCHSRKPDCDNCRLYSLCKYVGQGDEYE